MDGPQAGHDGVPQPVPRGQEGHHVRRDGRVLFGAAVPDPLPVPRLGADASPRAGPRRVVPAEPARLRGEEPVGRRIERQRALGVAEVRCLAPPVHGRSLRLARRRGQDRGGARAVPSGGPGLLHGHLVRQGPVALFGVEGYALVPGGGQEQAQARPRRPDCQAVGRHPHQVPGRHLSVDVACHSVGPVLRLDGRDEPFRSGSGDLDRDRHGRWVRRGGDGDHDGMRRGARRGTARWGTTGDPARGGRAGACEDGDHSREEPGCRVGRDGCGHCPPSRR